MVIVPLFGSVFHVFIWRFIKPFANAEKLFHPYVMRYDWEYQGPIP